MASPRPQTPGTSKPKPAPPRKAVVEDALLLTAVQSYFKKAAVVLAVWATGYFKFSPSWLLLGLVVYVWKERHQAKKKNAIAIAQAIARDEKAVILARVEDLPSWVSIFGLLCDSANLLADMKGRGGRGALFVRLGAWANTTDTVSVTCSWRS